MSSPQSLKFAVALALAASVVSCGNSSNTSEGVTGEGTAEVSHATTPAATQATSTSAPGSSTPGSSGHVVTFEVSGSGTAYSIDWDPGEKGVADRKTSVPLPWTGIYPDPGGVEIYQVVVVGGENPGCRILIDDKEVASEPPGGSAHCSYVP